MTKCKKPERAKRATAAKLGYLRQLAAAHVAGSTFVLEGSWGLLHPRLYAFTRFAGLII